MEASKNIRVARWFYRFMRCPHTGHKSPYERDNQQSDDRDENLNPHGTTSASNPTQLHHRPRPDILTSNDLIVANRQHSNFDFFRIGSHLKCSKLSGT